MKTLSIILSATALTALASCGSLGTQYGYVDDVYYNPANEAKKPAVQQFNETPTLNEDQQKAYNADFERLRSEYQKNDPQSQNTNAEFDQIQQQYAQILSNDTIAETDTMLYYNDETGYWVNGFEGSDMDRDYAERLARFHGPFNGIPYWSPLYNELVYGYNPYWNVYVDGNYAYMFPTWTNPYYFNYYSSPSWSFGFGWNYGWGYNNWGGNYWGLGFYDSWYDPWYGWNSPYCGWGSPWYYDHYYGGGGWGGGYSRNSVHAPHYGHASGRSQMPMTNGSSNRMSTSQYSGTTRGTYRTNSMTGTSYRAQQPSTLKSQGSTGNTEQRTSRRSYTPTYNQTQSTNRPSYNRTTTTTAPSQGRSTYTTPTSQSRSTYSGGRSTSSSSSNTSTQQRPSSYSGSTYKPSGNSNYRSTSHPSSSGSSSSGSSSSGSSSYSAPRSSSSSGSSYTPSSSGSSSYSGGSRSSGGGSYSGGGGSSSSGSSSGGSSSGGSRSSRR